MDEFAHHTPSAKAGVLHMRELTDDVLRTIARDGDHVTPEFREVYAFMESIKDGDRPTNADWITGQAIDELFDRGRIDGEQYDHMRREARL